MKTEYVLTNEEKKKIAELQQTIFDLQMKISDIYSRASVRYILDTDEERELAIKYFGLENKPMQGIAKLNFEPYQKGE
jgi:hypothetical protein